MANAHDPLFTFDTVFPRQLPGAAARVLHLYRQLRAFERFAPDKQNATMAAQLNHLLRHAKIRSPFWAERLSAWKPGGAAPFDVLNGVPILTRNDLQGDRQRLICDFPEREALGILTHTSSGSTGTPVSVELSRTLFTPLYQAVAMMGADWHGFDPKKPLGVVGSKEKDRDRVVLGPPFIWFGLVAEGFTCSTLNRDISEVYDFCAKRAPAYLQAGPQVFRKLANYALSAGRSELRFERAFTLGSSVTEDIRDVVRRGLGAEIVDRYSCEETGYIALQCPKHHYYHAVSPATYVEIVDKSGAPCPPGEPGRVLLTNPQSYAMPLIRYDIGDMAEWGAPCDCGSTLPVIAKLWGRIRHNIITPDGRETFAGIYARDFADIEGLLEYRFVLHQNAIVVAQLKTSRVSPEIGAAVTQKVQAALRYPYPVRIRYVDEIDWGTSWKQENFAVSDAAPPEASPVL